MISRDKLVEWLNRIEWRQLEDINPETMDSIQEHIVKIRHAINHICVSQEITVVEAHGFAQTAGNDSEYYDVILDDLFTKVQFIGAEERESIIATIAACYCWDLDTDLKDLPNPWIPLLKVFSFGYTAAPEDDENGDHVSIVIGCKYDNVTFPII